MSYLALDITNNSPEVPASVSTGCILCEVFRAVPLAPSCLAGCIRDSEVGLD